MAMDGSTAAVSSKEANTAALVRRLVRSTLAKAGASDVPDKAVEKLYRYSVRLVGSCLAASVEPDEGAAADAIKRRLIHDGASGAGAGLSGGSSNGGGGGASAGIKFAELHRRLSQQPGRAGTFPVILQSNTS
jgi:hypothetical protein